MKKIVGTALAFVVVGAALDLLGVQGVVPRTVFIAVMVSSLGYMASRDREHGERSELGGYRGGRGRSREEGQHGTHA